MKLRKLLPLALMTLATGSIVSGCGGQGRIQAAIPPVADMRVEPKPEITPDVLTSDVAAAQYDSAVEAWGERGWAAIARICQWAKVHDPKTKC